MKRAIALACAVAALGVGAAAGSESAATTTVFRDTIGEESSGPDITSITASSDGPDLTFRIAVPTNPYFTPDMRLTLWLDADDDLRTGLTGVNLDGWDHVMYVDPISYGDDTPHLLSCVGGVNVCGIPESRPEYSYSSGATVTLSTHALGLSRIERVRFRVSLATGIRRDPATGFDFTNARFDFGPDEGGWTFDAHPLRVTGFRIVPSPPRAGRQHVLTLRVVRSKTGIAPPDGKVSCSLTIAGRRVASRSRSFAGGQGRCVFTVPAGARGKPFRGTITVTALGETVRRSASGRVR